MLDVAYIILSSDVILFLRRRNYTIFKLISIIVKMSFLKQLKMDGTKKMKFYGTLYQMKLSTCYKIYYVSILLRDLMSLKLYHIHGFSMMIEIMMVYSNFNMKLLTD